MINPSYPGERTLLTITLIALQSFGKIGATIAIFEAENPWGVAGLTGGYVQVLKTCVFSQNMFDSATQPPWNYRDQ